MNSRNLKKILFISTHSFATNPRLVKEIELALGLGYKVSVVCFEFDNWSRELNEELKKRFYEHIKYYPVSGTRKPFTQWALGSVISTASKFLLFLFPVNAFLLSVSLNKRSWLLLQHLKTINEKINMVVAHNPGSFYPALCFSKKRSIPLGIDLEDYHPGETVITFESKRMKRFLGKVASLASYITAASDHIMEFSKNDMRQIKSRTAVIMNFFPSSEFIAPVKKLSGKLLLVWFSQNISANRGLEKLLPVIKNNNSIELHLYGNCEEEYRSRWLNDMNNVILHSSLSQNELHHSLSQFDIGLAIEPGKDLNNELAISNKILAYFQAGLFILTSDTKAQKKFINVHPEHGIVTALSESALKETLQQLIVQKQLINNTAGERYEKAKKHSWEKESEKLINIWQNTL